MLRVAVAGQTTVWWLSWERQMDERLFGSNDPWFSKWDAIRWVCAPVRPLGTVVPTTQVTRCEAEFDRPEFKCQRFLSFIILLFSYLFSISRSTLLGSSYYYWIICTIYKRIAGFSSLALCSVQSRFQSAAPSLFGWTFMCLHHLCCSKQSDLLNGLKVNKKKAAECFFFFFYSVLWHKTVSWHLADMLDCRVVFARLSGLSLDYSLFFSILPPLTTSSLGLSAVTIWRLVSWIASCSQRT